MLTVLAISTWMVVRLVICCLAISFPVVRSVPLLIQHPVYLQFVARVQWPFAASATAKWVKAQWSFCWSFLLIICFTVFKIPEVKFLLVGSAAISARGALPLKRKPQEVLGIVAGQELPRRGRCQHYAKSQRWFRFSCCSKVFPCDKCHDAETDHPNEHANRMICGYCSREQIYRPENCGICKAILIGKAGSGFWEGGKGTRNRALMSRKDPRKFKRVGGNAPTSKTSKRK
ncbi:unnamed protein product [Penicillium salamii]|uniref:CHY-type domain-containing protein n=1 Tax=Penicillium salamii TaxID=1612424 RepID=A0A9W4NTH7_9EURO|nr:unnamed protein product [Penicillium salamii]CAG8301398.1 unnamed protein product [Penicillium salamii]CAG8354152.1 unnamed protein product [Penicillium salamii]CAG8359963.1 unnamed protein product [Penicillium salamii]CAG8367603.1 unnamed protein product [Penicillium salamii]